MATEHQPQTQPQLGTALGCRLHNPEERPEEGGGHARALWAEAPSLLQSQRSWVWVLRDSGENGQRKVTAAPSAWKTKTNVSRRRSLRLFMSQKYWDYLNTANYFNVCCSFLHHHFILWTIICFSCHFGNLRDMTEICRWLRKPCIWRKNRKVVWRKNTARSIRCKSPKISGAMGQN